MAATPEAKVKKAIKDWLRTQNIYFISPIGGPYAEHGVPDIIICYYGTFVGCEVKAPIKIGKSGKPLKSYGTTKLQDDHIRRIIASQGYAFTVRSLEELQRELHKIDTLEEEV